jgi:hypothetical protein
MNKDLKYANWQEPLIAAILEFNPSKLLAKIQKAEAAIDSRFQELTFEKDSLEESRLLSDGRSILQDLKKNRLPLNPGSQKQANAGTRWIRTQGGRSI